MYKTVASYGEYLEEVKQPMHSISAEDSELRLWLQTYSLTLRLKQMWF